jgi:N-acyl-D-amino-acid deacylase
MADRSIPAGTLAVARDGKLLLARGYGHTDREGKRKVEPDTPFRLASLTKPITAAAVYKLIGDGKLSLDARVAALLAIDPPAGGKRDPRWDEITVRHLLEHRGGWDRDRAGDPMFQKAIARALGLKGPPTPADIVRYAAGQPLQFDPGSKSAYSNFGYCLLGRVIEKAAGQCYGDYVRKELLAPLGIRSVEPGRTLPQDRNPREPFYSHPRRGQDMLDGPELVPVADGSFRLEALDAHGGLIGSAPDLVRFLGAYRLHGAPLSDKPSPGVYTGLLPGTYTVLIQRADGVAIAALFNQSADVSGLDYGVIAEVLNRAADAVQKWPDR